MQNEDYIIQIKEARKRFLPNHDVLAGVNMAVQKNTIYGLLGPSGCGKTMLLTCILGMKPLTSGEIRLAVGSKKDIGYMPQEVALFKEFTVKEILHFYAALFGLTKQERKTRMAELTKVLELPEWKMNVGRLSGGEQRRVSFAAALIHDPKLLLLDEPTVGVDPILSHSMWQYLMKLSDLGKTIIITTHYVEEARNAHKIGMMREGKMICEDTPKNILINQQANSLEEAFLKLSMQQQPLKIKDTEQQIYPAKYIKEENGTNPFYNMINMNRLAAQILKNIIWMRGNTLIMFFLLTLPIMQSYFYSISFGRNPNNLKMIVMSDEDEAIDGNYCKMYRSPYIGDLNCTFSRPFTCHYANILNKSFDIVLKNSYSEAQSDVINNRAWGIIHIQSNFTDCFIERLYLEADTSSSCLNSSEILVTMDMSNYVIGNFIKRQIAKDLRTFMEDLSNSCSITHVFGTSALRFMDPVFGGKDPLFAHSGLPGFFCSFCFYFTMIFTSGAIMMEKIVGTLERSMAAGMTYLEVVCAHLTVQFVLMTVQKAAMFMVFYCWFDFPLIGDVKLIFLILYFIELVGVSYGFMLTEIFSSDRLVSYAGIGGTLAVFSLGGIIWPLEGAHYLIKSCIWALPVAPAVESYKNVASKGYSLSHSTVYFGILSCAFWTVALAIISVLTAKIKKYNRIL